MKSIDRIKLFPLTGLALGVTLEGTGAATAKIYPNGRIYINVTTTLENSKTLTLTTPYSLRVLDVKTIHGDGTASSLVLKNGSTAITSTIVAAASDKDVDGVRVATAGTIYDAQYEFIEGDDDMVFLVSVAAAFCDIVIDTVFI